MALPARDLAEIVGMDAKQREAYFREFARYMPDAPYLKYAIRIGSRTLYDCDTYELCQQFERHVRNLRRRKAAK